MSESRKIQDGWGCALKRWWKRCFRGGLATPGWHWMRGKAAVPFPPPPSPLNVLCKMHIAQRCALQYINIRQMKNAFSTKIGRVGEPKQGAGEEEHCSWRWSLPWFTTKASHSQQRVLSTVPFSSPGITLSSRRLSARKFSSMLRYVAGKVAFSSSYLDI